MTDPELTFPASFAQQRMWFLQRLRPEDTHYNTQVVLETVGPIDVGTLQAALRAVVERHEILRTTFVERDGELAQVVSAGPVPVVRTVELPGTPRDPEVTEELLRWIRLPFALDTGPLLRCVVVRLGRNHQLLLFVLHHIIADGWTLNLLAEEVGAAYRAIDAGTRWQPELLEIQYADFAEWQREQLTGPWLERELAYWRGRLGGELPVLDLPTDRRRPDELSTQGAREDFTLSPGLTESVRRLGRTANATPYMVLLAAFGVLLRRYGGQDDVVIGSPVACRDSDQVKPLLGLFTNTVAMRVDLSGAPTFRQLVDRVREVCLGAYAHQELPLDKIVEDLRPPRRPGRNPLFDVLFAVQHPPRLDLAIPGVRTVPREVERFTTRFDLELHFWEHRDHFTGAFVFATELFDRDTVHRLARHLVALLTSAVAEPDRPVSRLPMLDTEERERLCALAPGAPAEDDTLTAWAPDAALDDRADRLAAQLRRSGARPGHRVAIQLPPGPGEVAATLAVLKLGGVCVPLDPAHPVAFQRRIIAECVPDMIICTDAGAAAEVAPEAVPVRFDSITNPPDRGAAAPVGTSPPDDAPAFALWTPLGVRLLDHGTLRRQLAWLRNAFPGAEGTSRRSASPVLARAVWERALGIELAGQLYEVPESGVALGVSRDGEHYLPASEAVYVLDECGEPAPPGARGEIHFGPPGTDPRQSVPAGDVGKWTADGRLVVLATARHRVWVDGFPVNPADIAATLRADDAVQDCAVLPATDTEGATRLIAYVVPAVTVSGQRLADLVRAEWPAEAVPSGFVPVSSIPRTGSGAIDEAALGRLPVLDENLARRWENTLTALPEIDRAAVVIRTAEAPEERIHLGDLPAGAPGESRTVPAPPARASVGEPAVSHGGRFGDLDVDTLPAALLRAARSGRGTITCLDGDGSWSRTYGELLTEASRVLGGLRALGLRPGDDVLLQLEHNPDVLVSFWACVLGGFVPVPMAVPPAYELADSAVSKFVNAHGMLSSPWVLTSATLVDGIRGLATREGWPTPRLAVVDELRDGVPDDDWHPCRPDDRALMLLTSGSTGRPKAVVHTHRTMLSQSAGTTEINGFRQDDVTFNWMPLDHVGGIQMWHVRDVYLGCDQVHAPIHWVLEDPLRWLDCLDRFRATVTWAPNFAFGLVNDRAGELPGRKLDLSCVRHILNAGEAISAKIARRFLQVLAPFGLPGTAMRPGWGMSETASAITVSAGFTLETTSDDDPFVAVGRPYPGVGLRIVDGDDQVVDGDRTGRLQVTGPSLTPGYYRNPEQNRTSFTDDGWFDTGDLGYLRNGVLTITGRAKDVIIINGVNYYSHEIEAAVEELDAVANSFTAACGVRDPGGATDQVAIFFNPRDGVGEAQAIRDVRAQVIRRIGVNPAYLIPVPKEAIPKTEIGKIQRARLRDRFHDGDFAEICARVDLLLGTERTLPNWFYRVVWRRTSPVAGRPRPAGGATLVVLDRHGLGEQLCAELARRGEPTVRVEPDGFASGLAATLAGGTRIERIVDLGGYVPSSLRATKQALEEGRWTDLVRVAGLVRSVRDIDRRCSLYVVTSQAVAVRPHEVPACATAPVAGFVKSVDQEIPWLHCRHVDLTFADAGNAGHLLDELDSTVPESQVAYRDGDRFTPRLRRLAPELPAHTDPPRLRRGGLYVMSGGLGEVGVEIAGHLLREHGLRLLVLGRTAPEDRDAAYRRLSALGEIRYAVADVCDEARVRDAIRDAEAHWGCELAGVLHLAGLFGEGAATEQTDAELAAVLAPKARGAWVLHKMVRDRPGALFVSFSSVNGFFGGATVSAYSAANAFLDAFAAYQRELGLTAYSLGWSMWEELGMSRGYPLKDLTKARGFVPIGRRQGVQSFLAALRHDDAHLLIGLDAGRPVVAARLDAPARPLTRLAGYVTGALPDRPDIELADGFGRPSRCELTLLDELPADARGEIDRRRLRDLDRTGERSGAAHVEPRTDLERLVVSIWSQVLEVDRIGTRDNFFDLQGNSLLMARAHGLLERAVDRKLSLVDLFRYPTPGTLAAFLAEAGEGGDGATAARGRDRARRRAEARGAR